MSWEPFSPKLVSQELNFGHPKFVKTIFCIYLWTKIVLQFVSFSDNFVSNNHMIFQKSVHRFEIEHKNTFKIGLESSSSLK